MAASGMKVTKVWRDGSGRITAIDVTSDRGGRFTAQANRQTPTFAVMWAEPDVWAYPQLHGLERWFCPGHGTHPCQYGACDEIRVTDAATLRAAAEGFETIPA